jgi:hypothetical protein
MRQSSIGLAVRVAVLGLALGGCDIGARTRVESLYTNPGTSVAQIAVDEKVVYWTESAAYEDVINWSVKAVKKKDLPPASVTDFGIPGRFITVEAGTIWFADPAGNVSRRDPDGMVTPMFMPADATSVGLVRDDANLYQVITIGNPQTEWQLWAIPRDGYAPTMMTSEMTDVRVPLDLAADGTHVYVSVGGPIDQALVGEILRVAVGTTEVESFATDIHRPQVLRAFGENIFWYEVEEIQDSGLMKGRLQRSPKDGTDSRVLASITGATSLAVDDKFVYWVDTGPGLVWVQRVPHLGNNVITSMVVLEPAGASLAIADDETYVYWSDQGPPIPGLNRMLKK